MMKAYNKNVEYNNAILLYEQYNGQHDDVSNILFVKACNNNHSIEFINTLIDFYGKGDDIDDALNICNKKINIAL